MTSIIGYTRVPFNSSASRHFSIAPVKRLYLNNEPAALPATSNNNNTYTPDSQQQDDDNDAYKYNTARRPSYHRIFSREMIQQNGIIELIIDKKQQQEQQQKQQQQQSPLSDTTNRTTTINNNCTTKDNNQKYRQYHIKSNNYKIFLSIDLSGRHDYENLSVMNDDAASYDNLQRLIDSISKIVQEKTIHFVNILNLLKKLQLQQEQHRFMSCIDKHREMILIYFPNTISPSSVDQTYNWLKYTIGIDVNKFKQWKLSLVEEEEEQEVTNTTNNNNTTNKGKDYFDGESYFNDIHLFINHVDSLIESNGLFSHQKTKRTNYIN